MAKAENCTDKCDNWDFCKKKGWLDMKPLNYICPDYLVQKGLNLTNPIFKYLPGDWDYVGVAV